MSFLEGPTGGRDRPTARFERRQRARDPASCARQAHGLHARGGRLVSCPTLETIAAWTLDELAPEAAEQFEEHFFGCDVCFRQAGAHAAHGARARGRASPDPHPGAASGAFGRSPPPAGASTSKPGESGDDLPRRSGGGWLLGDACPARGSRARRFRGARCRRRADLCALRRSGSTSPRGEVVLACQVHYRALPVTSQMHVSLTAVDASGARPLRGVHAQPRVPDLCNGFLAPLAPLPLERRPT